MRAPAFSRTCRQPAFLPRPYKYLSEPTRAPQMPTNPSRRDLLKMFALASGSAMIGALPAMAAASSASPGRFVSRRPPPAQRKFTSAAVEARITRTKAAIGDPELAWLFENCYPNTLDTTVNTGTLDGKPDTFIVTGDIDAMWMRDSSAQVWPYLPLVPKDPALQKLFVGLIHRHARCIAIDPYANAFMPDPTAHTTLDWAQSDLTDMRPGVAERKWEIDSLCYPIRLAHGYWKTTGDTTPFDADWLDAMKRVLTTFREQQRKDGEGPYTFQRRTSWATDGVPMGGYGYPTKKVGLIHSMFRPSDDATIYPFLIPSNLFALSSLRNLRTLLDATGKGKELIQSCFALENDLI